MQLNFVISILIFLLYCSPVLQADDDAESFPDILSHLSAKNRYRIYYEIIRLNSSPKEPKEQLVSSDLVDEAFALDLKAGRLLLNDGKLAAKTNEFSIFYWLSGEKLHESYWLRPFTCQSARYDIQDSQGESGLLTENGRDKLGKLLVFLGQDKAGAYFKLHGLGALLAHAINSTDQLKREQHTDRKQPTSWIWTTDELSVKFTFGDSSSSTLESRLLGLKISIHEAGQSLGPLLAQWTVLRSSHQFDDRLLELPAGYSCFRQSIRLPVRLSNALLNVAPLTYYEYRLSVISDQELASPTGSDWWPATSALPEPMDSMRAPVGSQRRLSLMLDRVDEALFVSSLTREASSETAGQLSAWLMNSGQSYQVTRWRQQALCQGPRPFNGTGLQLSLAKEPAKPANMSLLEICLQDNGMELSLGGQFKLRLSQPALRWLTFTLQDRANKGQLVDVRRILRPPSAARSRSLEGAIYELTYSSFAHQHNLCLYHRGMGPMDLSSSLLVTRFAYSMAADQWTPISSSLMIYDEKMRRLRHQIELLADRVEPYSPWRGHRHLMADLSVCRQGARQSATIWLEYRLTVGQAGALRALDSLAQSIRSSVYWHFRSEYGVPLWRVPSIEVRLFDETLEVELRLLDKAPLVSEAKRVPLAGKEHVARDKYLDWLRQADRSVIRDSPEACAEYCQHYRCLVFVHCSALSECYLFLRQEMADEASSLLGNQRTCEAYKSDYHDQSPLKAWPLDEILDSVERSVDGQSLATNQTSDQEQEQDDKPDDPIERLTLYRSGKLADTPTLRIMSTAHGPMIKLRPHSARHAYHQDPEDHERRSLDDEQDKQLGEQFKLLFGGMALAPVENQNFKVNARQTRHLALDETLLGYLSLEHESMSLGECQSLCLADEHCRSLSFCLNYPRARCLMSMLSKRQLQEDANETLPLRLAEEPSCSVLQRTFIDQYEPLESRNLVQFFGDYTHQALGYGLAEEAEDCATSCQLNQIQTRTSEESNAPRCRSFDYCTAENGPSGCIFFEDHQRIKSLARDRVKGDHPDLQTEKVATSGRNGSDVLLRPLVDKLGLFPASKCRHFGLNHLASFHKIVGRRLPGEWRSSSLRNYDVDQQAAEQHELSLARCGRLCDQELSCGAFEFCAALGSEPLGDDEAPSQRLLMSCSLGANETLALVPRPTGSGRQSSRYVRDALRLARRDVCSVYVYRSSSWAGASKRRLMELISLEEEEEQPAGGKILGLDLLVTSVFFLLGFAARFLDVNQFSFRRISASEQQDRFDEISLPDISPASGRLSASDHESFVKNL